MMSGQSRRKFISKSILGFGGLALLGEPLISFWAKAWGKVAKKVLPKGTDRNSLINERPQDLDAGNLEVTPTKEFGIMGLSDHKVDLDLWTLKVKGWVKNPLLISYNQIRALPFIERKVLIDLSGIFCQPGLVERDFPPDLVGNGGGQAWNKICNHQRSGRRLFQAGTFPLG